jgi:SAM-dependent methyltransferase
MAGDHDRSAERTYEAFAPAYDDFTAHYDYELWLRNVLPNLERLGLRGSRLLDVGCGTGKSFLPMLKRGWTVTACDISPSMLKLADEKAGSGVNLMLADMRDLPHLGSFDLVWALDDTINYLLCLEELESALGGMARNLTPTGLLMFDVNTLQAYRTFFAETTVVEHGGRRMVWRGLSGGDAPASSICESRLEVDGPGSVWSGSEVPAHVHRQRHFPEREVLAALDGAGLECLGVFGHGHDAIAHQPLEELVHHKAVFVARHKSPQKRID